METTTSPHLPVITPWDHQKVDKDKWENLIDRLADEALTLFALWADKASIAMAVFDPLENKKTIASLLIENETYPSVARKHLPALRFERAIFDLYGYRATNTPDERPWLNHGAWGVSNPLKEACPDKNKPAPYTFLPVEGEGVHQIPVGPIHAGIIEPGHFRFSANGETVVRLEERLGYVHKGVEKLFEGADIMGGAKLAGRISGDSTVGYAYAYALAVEKALNLKVPPRATHIRALMAELERIANHFGDIGAICNDAAFSLLHAHLGILREETLQCSEDLFGHRMMMDKIIPGGVGVDLENTLIPKIRTFIEHSEKRFDKIMAVYDDTASLKDRTNGTGIVRQKLVKKYGAGGYVGRASGRAFDARKQMTYEPYDQLSFEMTVLHPGDVNSRVWVRRCDIQQSFKMIEQILNSLPRGAIHVDLPAHFSLSEGIGVVEGFRGDIFLYLQLGKDGRISRCFPRDPSWFQWPLLETAIEGNIVADFPLCNKSFNCSYSGHDL